jgi:PAS domain S-box-containing protein
MLKKISFIRKYFETQLDQKYIEGRELSEEESEIMKSITELETQLSDIHSNFNLEEQNLKNISKSGVAKDKVSEQVLICEMKNAYFELFQRQNAFDQHSIIAITDPKGIIKYVNQKFMDVSKYSREELLGKDHRILNSNYHPKSFFKNMYDTISKGDIWRGEIRNRTKDGDYYWVDTTIVPTKNFTGKIEQYIAIRTIITERKQAEEKIGNLLKEKDLLLVEVHHRIKNNMNTVFSTLRLHANLQEDPKAMNVLDDAARRVQSMMVLYDKLYRAENKIALSLKDYFPYLIKEILRTFSKKITLNVFVTDEIVLKIEKIAPISILLNELISNTMKYSFVGRGDGMITLHSSKRNNKIFISYEDDGMGLPEDLTLNNPSGFGLKLVSLLAKQLNGLIHIDREHPSRYVLEFEE